MYENEIAELKRSQPKSQWVY